MGRRITVYYTNEEIEKIEKIKDKLKVKSTSKILKEALKYYYALIMSESLK